MHDFEPVFTVTDYYDGPRAGIANFGGSPHSFRSLYADIDTNDDNVFALTPLDAETFRLALEDWAIWKRWESAFYAGRTDRSTHPALPEDRQRHEWLERELAKRMAPEESSELVAKGDFRAVPGQEQLRPGVIREIEVRWYEIGFGKSIVSDATDWSK